MRLYFHGNCQLPVLAKLFAEIRPDWQVSSREVHARTTLRQEAETRADAEGADVIVAQPIRRDYRGVDWLGLAALEAAARPGCTIIRVPSMFFTGQLPCWSYLGAGPGRLQGYRMSYHCLPVAAMVVQGLGAEAIVARVLAPDFLDAAWSRACLQRGVAELARREAEGGTDVPVSDIYAELSAVRQVGHTINHPVRPVFARVANRILGLLGEAGRVAEEGPDYLPLPHLALLPATASALGLAPDPAAHFKVGNRPVPPADYFRLLVAHYQALPEGALEQALRRSREAMAFLADVAAAHPEADWTRLERVAAAPPVPPPAGPGPAPRFTQRAALRPSTAARARVLATISPPWTRSDLGRLIETEDAEARAAIERVAPAARPDPFTPATFRLVELRDAVVINFPRTEGMVLDSEGRFMRGTRGSPRLVPENPFVQQAPEGQMRFRVDMPITGEIGRAFVGFCPASANYAHLLGLFVQRLMLARERLTDTAFLFPDLPEYRTHAPGALRNEFMFRLPEIVPLRNGNFYRPLRLGAYRVRELVVMEPEGDRWDLMFQPDVGRAFDALAEEALRRARLSGLRLPERLYVSRQGAAYRRIANHDAFLPFVTEAGFETVRMEELDFWHQAALFAAVRTVVTVHGAGCANLMFSRPGTTLIEMYPGSPISQLFSHTALARGCRYIPLPSSRRRRRGAEGGLGGVRAVLSRLDAESPQPVGA